MKTDLGEWVRVPRGRADEIVAAVSGASGLRIYQMNVSDGHLMVMVGGGDDRPGRAPLAPVHLPPHQRAPA